MARPAGDSTGRGAGRRLARSCGPVGKRESVASRRGARRPAGPVASYMMFSQKLCNRIISALRVGSEHAHSGSKGLRMFAGPLRSRGVRARHVSGAGLTQPARYQSAARLSRAPTR